MKRFYVDTNFHWFGPHKPAVFPNMLPDLGLIPGEKVMVFQDEGDEWTGTVRFDSTIPEQYQWYVQLDD